MAKTKHISSILYIERNNEHDKIVMDKISHKKGVQLMCEYVDPTELLEAAVKVFQQSEQYQVSTK